MMGLYFFRLMIWMAVLIPCQLAAQDSLLHRIVLIGDAGEMDDQQKWVLQDAASRTVAGKTTAFFLGDNIYKRGMALPGTADQEKTEDILRSQFAPLRKAGMQVWFIPGNHDWDKMGKAGLAKIKRQWAFINEQNDSLLQLVPPNGCPDPVAIHLSDSLVVIAMDSEWWLFPFSKENPGAECDCNSQEEIIASLRQLEFENRGKMIILANHHPFATYGIHGGKYGWKDHLFPLTHINPKLKIPLPIVGSLYPLLRKTFNNPEDLKHPLYQDMMKKVRAVFDGNPNVVIASGHEHGLQYIQKPDGLKQIVSGAGAKLNHTIKGKYSKYGEEKGGYVVADWLTGSVLKIQFYRLGKNGMEKTFEERLQLSPATFYGADPLKNIEADSVVVSLRKEYNDVSKAKRKWFGENYRKEFATPVKLPVLRLSELHGGLQPVKRGGGMQTVSLRLKDASGKEWVLRNIEKNPDPLLPETLRGTFARDVLDDYMSAQHPFAPLIVPTLAEAIDVPHATPLIGVVAADSSLGIYQREFVGKIALLEQREPIGKSDNSIEMLEELKDDNDNGYNAQTWLRARMLDLLLGDWDRHPDQWRWADTKKGKGKYYEPVPRDRDQALFKRQGILPNLASRSWILPTLQGFEPEIDKVKYSLIKSGFQNAWPQEQWPKEKWDAIVKEFVSIISDSLVDAAFLQLPPEIYAVRGEKLAAQMKQRRDRIGQAMSEYYGFVNKIVDIRLTNKHESIKLSTSSNGELNVLVRKINKEGLLRDTLINKNYDPSLTDEIRIYMEGGRDSIAIDNHTKIRLRIIGGEGSKYYGDIKSRRRIRVYDLDSSAVFSGAAASLRKKLGSDTTHTGFVATNLYNITMPLITGGYNLDDGLLLGLGFQHTHQGFRKQPFASRHQLTASHSFSTKAYRIRYKGLWTDAWKKADFYTNLLAKAPDNTQNYFGRGNATVYDKSTGSIRYYRARFAIYQADLGLRWENDKALSISTGPSVQYYHYNNIENKGRFLENAANTGTYDSSHLTSDKWHAGWTMQLIRDARNHSLIPQWGWYTQVKLQAYNGMGKYARSYAQGNVSIAVYKPLNTKKTIVLAERVGAGFTVGKAAFYQSQFLGGHENLQGFRQYRFAGQHLLFNNLELRIKLADWGSYILPGQFGFTGFYDLGRVWQKGEDSERWHQGVGGGFYFAPAQLAVVQLVAGYSREGWLPYFTVGFRF